MMIAQTNYACKTKTQHGKVYITFHFHNQVLSISGLYSYTLWYIVAMGIIMVGASN